MKTINCLPKFIIFGILIYLTVNTVQAQYITIEGKQFKNGAQDFYPMVCNYNIMLTNNDGDSTYYVSRNAYYGEGISCQYCAPLPNVEFECVNQATAYSEMIADFTKIRNMGFNAVRIVGVVADKEDTAHTGNIGFYVAEFPNTHPFGNACCPWPKMNIDTPYTSDPVLQNIVLPAFDIVLQAADSCNLKVILLAGGGDIHNHLDDASDYAAYMSVVADHLKNNTALMAYDLCNEPYLKPSWNMLPKQQVCDYTTQWYDAVKTAAPNHLVTIGGHSVWNYDPAVMKLDFGSAHFYPYIKEYENWNPTDAFKRVHGEIVWLNQNSPMPWIIGETGFKASDDYYRNSQNWVPVEMLVPEADGNLAQQATYAQNTLNVTRNCGGSGYSWWDYQEGFNREPCDGFGLLKHGALDTINKPVADVFDTLPPISNCDYPSNYTDPDNWDYYCPPPCLGWYQKLHGTITETGTTNPIADAVIGAWTWYDTIPGGTPIPSSTHTFSDYDGGYSINPKYPNSVEFGYDYEMVTAAGAEIITNWGIISAPWEYNENLIIYPFKYDLVINNETVIVGYNRNFHGWSTLTVNTLQTSTVVVQNGAVSEFKARDGVTINGGFTAELGSDVYIYCTSTFPECNDFDFSPELKSVNAKNNESQENTTEISKQIDVKFNPVNKYAYLDVYPNPGNGIFTLNLRTNKENNSLMRVNVYDITGSSIYKGTINENISNLNLSFLSKGIYYLHASTKDDSFNQKLIIK